MHASLAETAGLDPLLVSAIIALAAIALLIACNLLAETQGATFVRSLTDWLRAIALAAAYWATAVFGLQWAAVEGAGSPVWPAAGVGLAGLLIGGVRLWPAILLGRLAAAVTTGSDQPWWAEVAIAAGNAGATVLPILVLRRWFPIDMRLTAIRDVVRLAAAAVAGGALAALAGTATLSLSSDLLPGPALRVGAGWWLGASVGALLLAPLLLAWSYGSAWRMRPWHWLGLGSSLVVTAALSYGIFFETALPFLRAWYVYPALIWLAVSCQVRGVSLGLLIVTAAATSSATFNVGPFTPPGEAGTWSISLAQQFTLITLLAGLIIAAAADERRGLEALHRSEARESSIVNTAVDPIIVIDERAAIVSFNPAAERTFGYEAAEVLGENVRMLMPEPHRSAHDSYMERYHRTGERRIIGIGRQVEGLRRDGTTFPLDLSVAEWRADDKVFYTGIIHEQTERAKAEEALRASEHRLATAIEASGGGVYEQAVPASDGLFVTSRWLGILGYQELPVPPEHFDDWLLEQVHPEDRVVRQAAWTGFIEGTQPRYEAEVRKCHASGRWIWVRSYAQATERSGESSLVEAIVTLGHRLGKRVVAEGVETEAQLQYLMAIGCDGAQGYHLCKPVEAHEVEDLLRSPAPSRIAQARLL